MLQVLARVRNGARRVPVGDSLPMTRRAPGEDGFAPDSARSAGTVAILEKYHSADSNRDGRIDLLELTRVIELYNYRNGSLRTGEYREATGTEDGFAPGP